MITMDAIDKTGGGDLGDGKWEIYQELRRIEVAVGDADGEWAVITVTQQSAQHLRDFAKGLERAADYLEGK